MVGTLLTWMQERNADGALFLGPPGSGKTAVGKAIGATFNTVTIGLDFSGLQSGIVGSSGEFLRNALSVIDAISQGQSLWIGTCNSIASLPSELRRRFQQGTLFFDLPDSSAREALWKLYEGKYNVSGKRPKDEGWTGAEIKECCRKADRFNISLIESADYIVPVAKSAGESIESLRRQSSGKFTSAAYPGLYIHEEKKEVATGAGKRRFMEN